MEIFSPWSPLYIYGLLYKYLMEAVGNKEFIHFAILGLPQSGKTHFIKIVRGEKYKKGQTSLNGEDVKQAVVRINGKTLIYEKGRDISGYRLQEYPKLIRESDIIYFFFRADFFMKDVRLKGINHDGAFSDKDINEYQSYRPIVISYLGSVIRDPNAKNKPIKIIASFRKKLENENDIKVLDTISKELSQTFSDDELKNCAYYLADIDDDHREWVTDYADELIFNQK